MARRLDHLKLRALRQAQVPPVTQDDMARAAGVSRSTYASWEAGATVPSVNDAAKCAARLGVTLDYLMTDDDESAVAARR